MRIDSFREMYDSELSEAISFEAMMAKTMPELAELASDPHLRDALSEHGASPHAQDEILTQLRFGHGGTVEEHVDQSMQAMIGEALKMARMTRPGPVRDAAIIASLQRLKHYEVAVYGTLASYADALGLQDEKQALGGILQQEKAFDERLTAVAKNVVNPEAAA